MPYMVKKPLVDRVLDRIPDSLVMPVALGGIFSMLTAMAGISCVMNMESEEDLSRKPDVIAGLSAGSEKVCALPSLESEKASYQTRLNQALAGTRAERLDYFAENKITICLDERLAKSEPRVPAVFYPDANMPVMALADLETDSENTQKLRSIFMHQFAAQFEKAATPQKNMVGHSYMEMQVCSEYCVTFTPRYVWKEADAAITIPPPPLAMRLH